MNIVAGQMSDGRVQQRSASTSRTKQKETDMSPNSASGQTYSSEGTTTSWKDSVAGVASQAGEAAKNIRDVSQTIASQVGTAASGLADTSSDLATSAKEHAKTFASELEGMARRNPLGTIAGALLVGVVIGMMFRGR
jgi:ElaB/YqjD/DUF883 family membrane-anchored ribosome-binding protein